MPIITQILSNAIVYKKDKRDVSILLVKDDSGYTFPNLQLDEEEEIGEKTLRSAHAQTNIDELRMITDLGRIKYWFQDGSNLVHRRVYNFLFECPQTIDLNQPKYYKEDIKWFSPQDALANLSYKDDKMILKKGLNYLKINIEDYL